MHTHYLEVRGLTLYRAYLMDDLPARCPFATYSDDEALFHAVGDYIRSYAGATEQDLRAVFVFEPEGITDQPGYLFPVYIH